VSRPWLALVLVLFCLPLFANLRGLDLETDEAIYSFAVDRILADAEWLRPKSSPSETAVFLEKPPLKFWIVAAPIRAGLLPHDEFGLRFWDALFAAVAFVYVFATGSLLAGPVCGAVAVTMLFVHAPLLLVHGVRTNNMESALVLCYCGGVYHYLAWARPSTRRKAHALATAGYFSLGFLTKFVAALFLPVIVLIVTLLFRSLRVRLAAEWRLWALACAFAALLVIPWFAFAFLAFGTLVWNTMFAAHVYERLTTSLNPLHVEPWSYYVVTMWREFERAGVQWLAVAGLAILVVQSVRRRWPEGAAVCLWAVVPLGLMSIGSSKLYHYAYPFIPPVALAAAYPIGLTALLGPVVVRKLLDRLDDAIARRLPGMRALAERGWVRGGAAALIVGAVAVIVWTVVAGQARLSAGHTVLFRSTGLLRPLTVLGVASVVARRQRAASVLLVAMVLLWLMPHAAYREILHRLGDERHPLRDAAECVRRVQAALPADARHGLYVDGDGSMWHPINYYFRRVQPWTHQPEPSAERLARYVNEPGDYRPSLVQETRYRAYAPALRTAVDARASVSPPMIGLHEYVLLLPGPYRVCSPESRLQPLH
jgi:4-amino-4-deoxy-L-arabinose transferase-like glycosyltransferase